MLVPAFVPALVPASRPASVMPRAGLDHVAFLLAGVLLVLVKVGLLPDVPW